MPPRVRRSPGPLLLPAGLALALAACAADAPAGGDDRPAAPARGGAAPDPASPPGEAIVVTGVPRAEWDDPTAGPTATLLYVTEKRTSPAGPTKPAVLIVSSDPTNDHFKRRSTAVLTVQRTRRADLGALLGELAADGLDGLPWAPHPADAPIGPERALYLFRDGACRVVRKASLAEVEKAAFTAVERRLIAASLRYETAGAPGSAPPR